jgi:phosphatidylinositol glycan class M
MRPAARRTLPPTSTSPVSPSIPDDSLMTLMSFRSHLYLAFVLRLAFLYYGYQHDRTMMVKYTDVDYKVVTDAARHMHEGDSPYDRHTYRYTPLLAWLLLPNITVGNLWGKLLFCAFDIFAGQLIYAFVRGSSRCMEAQARLAALTWLYNPLVIGVSTRGNAEAIVCTLVLITLYLFREKLYVLAGFAFGLAIHFKIYPIIYSIRYRKSMLNIGRG